MKTTSAQTVRPSPPARRRDSVEVAPIEVSTPPALARADTKTDSDPTTRLRVAIDKLSRRLRPTVAGSGLTPSQTSVLFTVVRLGPLGLSEISEIEQINPTMLSRIVAQLCESGLISREPDPGDRRVAFVKATPAGQRLRKRIHRERAEALQRHMEKLSIEQRAQLWEALPVLEALAEQLPRRRP